MSGNLHCIASVFNLVRAGEDAGDENIKLKASSWAAWVQIQVNTETARADLLEMMGEDPEGVREHR